MAIPNRFALPEPVSGYELNARGFWSVVVPEATTNLITNPSFELGTTGYTAKNSVLTRGAAMQAVGAYSLWVVPIVAGDGVYWAQSLTSGVTYTWSLWINTYEGMPLSLSITDGAFAPLISKTVEGSSDWNRVSLTYRETATNTRRLLLATKENTGASWFTDGWQLEAKSYMTDYVDGDQDGCYWGGYPHASASFRPGNYRDGGRVAALRDLGFRVSGYVGASAAPVRVVANEYGSLDGAYYQKTVILPGALTLTGRFYGESLAHLQAARRKFWNAVKPDLVLPTQPATLAYQLLDDCGKVVGEELRNEAVYSAGWEGSADNLNQEQAAVSFMLPDPHWHAAASQGTPLDWSDTLAVHYIMAKMQGAWNALGNTGTGTVYAIAIGPDGCIYIGGDFVNWAGVAAADYVAKYDPATATWSALGAPGEAANRKVYAIAVTPEGDVYVGGQFEDWAGNANSDKIAMWDASASAWVAVGTGCQGTSCDVKAIVCAGQYVFAGGSFTGAGGVADTAYLAYWDIVGAAWHSLGVVNSSVYALAGSVEKAKLWAGGLFATIIKGGVTTTCNCIAEYDGNAGTWSAMANGTSVGMNSFVNGLALDQQGNVYACGNFTTSGGVATNYIAKWNGTSWSALGSGLNGGSGCLAFGPDGTLYVGGAFNLAGGNTVSQVARWREGVWLPLDCTPPALTAVYAIAISRNGEIVLGFDHAGNASVCGSTAVDNTGTAAAQPIFRFRGPCRVVSIRNETTDEEIGFNLTLYAASYATLDLRPGHLRFECAFLLGSRTPGAIDVPGHRVRGLPPPPAPAAPSTPILPGSIMKTILPGSSLSTFCLQPGRNAITAFMDGTTADTLLTMEWRRRFWGVEGGVGYTE
jgi:hypothetical protein